MLPPYQNVYQNQIILDWIQLETTCVFFSNSELTRSQYEGYLELKVKIFYGKKDIGKQAYISAAIQCNWKNEN